MGKLEAEVEHEDCESCESDVEDIAVQVERAIKALPTLQEKVQAVAINGYLEQKKKLDEELEKEISKIELKYRTQMLPFFDKVNRHSLRSTPLLKARSSSRTRTSKALRES